MIACVDFIRSKYNIGYGKILLCGFSRGATLSYYFAASPEKVDAINLMDGILNNDVDLTANPKVPFYIMGSHLYEGQLNTANTTLTAAGFDVLQKWFEGTPHDWPIAENPAIITWFESKW
ncbi:MAG: alpha/beta hydrolase [Planctomycetota bacterium]